MARTTEANKLGACVFGIEVDVMCGHHGGVWHPFHGDLCLSPLNATMEAGMLCAHFAVFRSLSKIGVVLHPFENQIFDGTRHR